MSEQTEREPTEAEISQFRRAARALDKLGRAGLYVYLANDTLNLMTGPSHDGDMNGSARQERIRAEEHVTRSGGGDW